MIARRGFATLVLVFTTAACTSLDSLTGGTGSTADAGDAAVADDAACEPVIDIRSNPDNCGTCGHRCLGGACQDGVCGPVQIAVGQPNPEGIAVDRPYVYWTNAGDGTVVRTFNFGGGSKPPPPEIVARNQSGVRGIAARAGDVFWTNQSAGTVMKLVGNTPVSVAGSQASPVAVALGVGFAVWANAGTGGTIGKLSSDNALDVFPSVVSQPTAIAADGSRFAWASSGPPPFTTGSVFLDRVPIGTNLRDPRGLAMHGGRVAWTTYDGGEVFVATDSIAVTLATGQFKPLGVVLDDTHVYWGLDQPGGAIYRASLTADPNVTRVASDQANPHGLAIDDRSIYWTNNGNGTVMRLAK